MLFHVLVRTIDCPGCGLEIPTPDEPERWLQPLAWCHSCGGQAVAVTPDSVIATITGRWPHAEVTFPMHVVLGEEASN